MFISTLFQVVIVKPIFNLLVLIYALLPGHNFGLAIILFTIIVRLLMWPLVKKQLHHAKAMRALQPELKRIKKDAAGDRQKESLMVMELYKERGISPFGTIGILVIQFIILIGLYAGLRHVVTDHNAVLANSYAWLHHLPWLQTLSTDIHKFDSTLLGFIDLTQAAVNKGSGIYWPAMFLVLGSAIAQYFQSVQLMPKPQDGRSLRQIMKDAGAGKQADQAEVSAAVSRSTRFFIPAMIFIFTLNLPSALSLYWMVGAIVAYIQQSRVLNQDEEELEAIADKGSKAVIEGEVVQNAPLENKKSKITTNKRKRRKRV